MAINSTNAHIDVELGGLTVYGDYTGTNKECIQSLMDLIAPEYTQVQRGYLDQISPEAHRQLLKEFEALLAAVENV